MRNLPIKLSYLRLVVEKAVSKSQQAIFGIALSVKRGKQKLSDIPDTYRDKVKEIVDGMTEKQIEDYAKTKTTDLPQTVEQD